MSGNSVQNISNLHNIYHEDYMVAKSQIQEHLGNIDNLDIFGREVLLAVYVRPMKSNKGVHMSAAWQREDVYQGKTALILKMGPGAFQGDESYVKAMFGDHRPPARGDWVMVRPNDGMSVNIRGDGGTRSQVKDFRGDDIDAYGWDGWPCRIVLDEAIIGRLVKPHNVV